MLRFVVPVAFVVLSSCAIEHEEGTVAPSEDLALTRSPAKKRSAPEKRHYSYDHHARAGAPCTDPGVGGRGGTGAEPITCEPSYVNAMTNRLIVTDVPTAATVEIIRSAFSSIGNVLSVQLLTHGAPTPTVSFSVLMGAPEEAANARAQLNGTLIEGAPIHVEADTANVCVELPRSA